MWSERIFGGFSYIAKEAIRKNLQSRVGRSVMIGVVGGEGGGNSWLITNQQVEFN